ncbi:MAG: ABC transporter substrate-binding protein [Thermoanaerobaculia bacterium]
MQRATSRDHDFRLILLLVLSACREQPAPTTTDDLARPVAVPREIRRVVTLAPNLTEILFALGAGERIVGVDDHSNFPAVARGLPKVGGMQPNIEKIVALKPDIVFASTEGNHPNLAPALAAANVSLFVVRTDRLSEIPVAMRRLSSMLGAREDSVRQLERAVAAQKRMRANAPRVLFAVWTDPLYVAGRATFTDDLFVLTGARNAVEVTGWPQYSLESLAAAPPDILLYPRGAVTPRQVDALLKRVPGLQIRVVPVNEDIFQRPGPRMAEAAAALNAILDAP